MIVADTSLELCLRAAVGIAFNGLLRVSEYALVGPLAKWSPALRLTRADVTDLRLTTTDDVIAIKIKASKTDLALQGATLSFVAVPDDPLCCVATLRKYIKWRDSRHFDARTPFFLFADGSPLRRSHIANALKAAGPAFGILPANISTHSLRHGGAMNLKDAGLDWETIMTRGRWSLANTNKMAVHYSRFSVARNEAVAGALALNGPAARVFALNV